MTFVHPNIEVQSTKIGVGDSGDNTIIAAVADKIIQVFGFQLETDTSKVGFYWRDGTANLWGDSTHRGIIHPSVSLTGMSNKGIVVGPSIVPIFWTQDVNRAVILNLDGAVAVGGAIQWNAVTPESS